MVNLGSSGGGVREQEKLTLFHVHCVAPDSIFDAIAVQDSCENNDKIIIFKNQIVYYETDLGLKCSI